MQIQQHVGLDVHKKTIYAVVIDNNGDLLFKEKILNDPKLFDKFLTKIDKNTNIALKSCICWEHVYDHIDNARLKKYSFSKP